MIRYLQVHVSGNVPCADKNSINRMVTASKLLWSCVLSQVTCLDRQSAPDNISSHVRPCTHAERPQSLAEAGTTRPLPCPGAVWQPTPGVVPISDHGRRSTQHSSFY
jgi:hypothetical protein